MVLSKLSADLVSINFWPYMIHTQGYKLFVGCRGGTAGKKIM